MIENLNFNKSYVIGNLSLLGSLVVTPELANKLLQNNNGNRKLNKSVVSAYVRDMKANQWDCMPEGLSVTVDKDWNILNGQHRLSAICESGIPLEMFFYQKDIESNAVNVVTDSGLNRSLSVLTNLSTIEATTISSIIRLGDDSGSGRKISSAEILDFKSKLNPKECDFILKMCSSNKSKARSGVRGAFFYKYLEEHDDYVIDTWKAFASFDEYNPITNRLRSKLLTAVIPDGSARYKVLGNITYSVLNNVPNNKINNNYNKSVNKFNEMYNQLLAR